MRRRYLLGAGLAIMAAGMAHSAFAQSGEIKIGEINSYSLLPAFTEPYRQHRPMVERSLAWLIRRGGRKVRYRGIARNRIELAHRCAAVNLHRLINLRIQWHDGWGLAT